MSSATAEEVAQRVAEILAERAAESLRLLSTEAVAEMLAVSEEWVRGHAVELGAIRVGDGPKGALRYDPSRVRAALEGRRLNGGDQPRRRRGGRQRRSAGIAPEAVPADVKDW